MTSGENLGHGGKPLVSLNLISQTVIEKEDDDEIKSSSSSSIGEEENANLAFGYAGTSGGVHKKGQLFKEEQAN
jgi:hypothetical protein